MKAWENPALKGDLRFSGVDLAWGFRRPSSLCIIRKTEEGFRHEATLTSLPLGILLPFFGTRKALFAWPSMHRLRSPIGRGIAGQRGK